MSYTSAGEASLVEGETHKSIINGLAVGGETVLSVGYDDVLREVEGSGTRMTYVLFVFIRHGSAP